MFDFIKKLFSKPKITAQQLMELANKQGIPPVRFREDTGDKPCNCVRHILCREYGISNSNARENGFPQLNLSPAEVRELEYGFEGWGNAPFGPEVERNTPLFYEGAKLARMAGYKD